MAVWLLILLYVVFFGSLVVRRHDAFQSTAFDLGNVDQAVWNTRHGRPFVMTNIEGLTNRLGTHVEPILPSLSLLYLIWSDPRALLLFQTIIIALGAWPVYLLARRQINRAATEQSSPAATSALALAFALAYLLFPALQSANLCDFHALALAPTFFLAAFYCLETEQWWGLAFFSVLTAFCKEDMPLLVVMLGLYALIVRRKWRIGLAMVVAAGAWFVLATGWILPRFDTANTSPLANRYAHLGDTPLEIAASPIMRPGTVAASLFTADNLAYLRNLGTPVAFLSLLAPQVFVLSVPTLAVNLLSSESFMHQLEGGYYYGVTLVPIVVVAAAYGAAWLVGRFPRFQLLPLFLAALVLTTSLLYHHGHGYTPLAADFSRYRYAVNDHHRLGSAMAQQIPADASVAALARLTPHVSQRQEVYTIDRVEDGLPAFLHKTDYIWLDVTNGWPLNPNDLKASVENLLTKGYGVERASDGWLLLRLGALDKTLPDPFYDFVRASDPQPQTPTRIQFLLDGQPVLECLGFDYRTIHLDAQITLYWRVLRPLPPDLRPVLFHLAQLDGTASQAPVPQPLIATAWIPPERWPTGEVVATSTAPWLFDSTADFAVGLGVVRGDDWSDQGRRLSIQVVPSVQPIHLFEDNTWACLLEIQGGQPVPNGCE
jgi:uncharacterized membrane protein